MGRERALQDTEELPAMLTVTDFNAKRGTYCCFSRSQCARVLDMLKSHLEKPEVQSELDEMEKEAQGDNNKLRVLLSKVLMEDAYPPIIKLYGIKINKAQALTSIPAAMVEVSRHLDLLEQ